MELRDVRQNYGKIVIYNGIRYRLDKCIEIPDGNGYRYSLELHDLHAVSVVVAKIEDVEIEKVKGA